LNERTKKAALISDHKIPQEILEQLLGSLGYVEIERP
jgi:hypothetical protein